MGEIKEIVLNAPITEEPGIFKHGIDVILPLVKRLFNILFDSGEFPDDWELSFIVPVHKKGDKY